MKKLIFALASFALAFISPSGLRAQECPLQVGYVNDFAEVFGRDEAERLSAELKVFNEESSVEVVVVTLENLGGHTVEHYARALANAWGVGKRDSGKGVVLLLALQERKVRIEVATTLEGVLNDAAAAAVVQNDMVPLLKASKMDEGMISGARGVMSALKNPSVQRSHGESGGLNYWKVALLVVGIIVLVAVLGPNLPDVSAGGKGGPWSGGYRGPTYYGGPGPSSGGGSSSSSSGGGSRSSGGGFSGGGASGGF